MITSVVTIKFLAVLNIYILLKFNIIVITSVDW